MQSTSKSNLSAMLSFIMFTEILFFWDKNKEIKGFWIIYFSWVFYIFGSNRINLVKSSNKSEYMDVY